MPTDQIDSFRVICQGGLNTNENSLTLSQESPGAATRLVNFESSVSGGYRRISGFTPRSADFPVVGVGLAEGPVLWTAYFFNTTSRSYQLFAARKDIGSATYSIWELTGGGWVKVVTPVRNMSGTYAEVIKLRHIDFNFGSGNNAIFVDGVNYALWYNGTTWLEIKSTNAGGIGTPGGNQVIDQPAYVTVFKNHIFLAGDRSPDGEGRFVHSAPNDPTTWTSAAGAGQLFPGFNVVQIRPFRDELYVFGLERIRKVVIGDVTTPFLVKDVTNDLGCVASDSVVEIAGNLIFLSHDGIRPVAGTERINDVELGLLSQDIQPIIDQLVAVQDFSVLNSVVIKKKTQFRYTWSDELTDTPYAQGLLGCVRVPKQGGKIWEFGELLGIRTTCMWSGLVNGHEVVLHGDFDGTVYEQEVGSDFNGANITSIYSSPFLDIGDTTVRKTMREMNTFIDAEGSVNLFLGINIDWDLNKQKAPADYPLTITSGNSLYDSASAIYDNFQTIYGAPLRTTIHTDIQGSCFSVKFTYVNVSTDPSFTIQGFVPTYSIKGRQ